MPRVGSLLDITRISSETGISRLFENAIINQLSRYGGVSFYNQRNVSEIDAIVNKEIALEIKLRGTPADVAKLRKQCKKLEIGNYAVVSRYFSTDKEIFPGLLL